MPDELKKGWVRDTRRKTIQRRFDGLPSDKTLHKARLVPLSSKPRSHAQQVYIPIRWTGKKNTKPKLEVPVKEKYRPPCRGVPITADSEKQEIAKQLLSSQSFKTASVSMHRILDIISGQTQQGHAQGAPHVTKSEHQRHDVIYSQGSIAAPGVFFIFDGQVKLSRRSEQAVMDQMQRKLFVIGAFNGISDDESNALRKPKSSEKEWELATLGPGNFIGLNDGLAGGHYLDTARSYLCAKVIFIPADVLGSRLQDVRPSILHDLQASALSRDRQFERVLALFEEGHGEDKKHDTDNVRLSIDWKKKKMDTGLSHVTAPVFKAEGEKRYFRSRGSDVAYAGPYAFKPGEVPQINPDIMVAPTDRTAMQFLHTGKTFGRPKESGLGPDLRLPPRSDMSGTRIGRLYQRLWENCSANTWATLLDMQVLDQETYPISTDSLQTRSASCADPSFRALVMTPEGVRANKASETENTDEEHVRRAEILRKVPTLNLYKATMQQPSQPQAALTERPSTESGRSRSARAEAFQFLETDRFQSHQTPFHELGDKQRRRPMTSRSTVTGRHVAATRLDFRASPSSAAASQEIAWSESPAHRASPSLYIARTSLTPRV